MGTYRRKEWILDQFVNYFKELRRKEQAETSQGVINVQSDLDWKRDETSRILEGLGLPEQAQQGEYCQIIIRK